jgi:DNA polymerase-4
VEVLDNPVLAGRPVIVGGSGTRGVVAACTYQARMFGVRSAMPSAVARRLCPQAVYVPGRHHRYAEESAKLHDILESFTPLVEGISLDEAFLDVTGSERLRGHGPVIAADIRRRVADEMHLDCSVGVARSKLMAKLASKQAKPVADRTGIRPGPGVVTVSAQHELDFLHPLPIRALWGVGPMTARRLEGLGIRTVGGLALLPASMLERQLGRAQATHLAALSRGEDRRPVVPNQDRKSIGHEETFPSDLRDSGELHAHLLRMVDLAATHLRKADLAARTVTVKVRFGDFTLVTRSHSLVRPVDSGRAMGAIAAALLDSVDLSRGIRLLGVSLSGFAGIGTGVQLALDLGPTGADVEAGAGEDDGGDVHRRDRLTRAEEAAERLQQEWERVTVAVDDVRSRYGSSAVRPASLVGRPH